MPKIKQMKGKKKVPIIYVRGKHAYRRAGSFISKTEAIRYKNQALHSIMLTIDSPQLGVGVRYHVYRRIS